MERKMKAEEKCEAAGTHTHVLIFPGPIKGDVHSMLKLAQLLALHRFYVTFLNTDHLHDRLQRFGDIEDLLESYPTLQFKTIPDGLPEHHPRSGDRVIADVYSSMNLHAKPLLRDVLLSAKPKVTCLISDGFFGGLNNDVANEVGIPVIHYHAISVSCFWAFFWSPKLFESNELPIRGEEDMDRIITGIPGMENVLRCRDLPRPSFRQGTGPNLVDPLKSLAFESHQTLRANALILNTFEDLDGPLLSQIRLKFPKVFAVGPLHAHLNSRRPSNTKTTPSTNSFWEVDRTCLTWLDSQPLKSVIYVSFGSITTLTRESLMEIWYGLVNSKKRFLWVVRPDMVVGKENGDQVPAELEEGTKERGFMVGWAPQEEVLAHSAVGGFLTHSGWNSTLESVVAGVPMVCWPYFADQMINSRLVSEVWKLGLDMKDVCDRNVVENMVNDLMVHRKEEFFNSAQAMAMLAHRSVSQGGSSYSSLDDLIQYLKSTSQENH